MNIGFTQGFIPVAAILFFLLSNWVTQKSDEN